MMQIIERSNEFNVVIGFDRFKDRNNNEIKKISGAKFNWTRKMYQVPLHYRSELEVIKEKCRAEWIKIEDDLPEVIGEIAPMPDLHFDIGIVNKENGFKPRPYQLQGIARGIQLKKFINGDEQGLGKTLQSIGTIYAAAMQGEIVYPCLVICPSSTKINWKREWEMWTGKKAIVLDDKIKNTCFHCQLRKFEKVFC
jgi:SWI/SNF-related matrix-associated actin-dependent regulator of chromatin subfamily A-like protein 1